MSGDLLALGAMAVLAAAGAVRRGSRSVSAFRSIASVPRGYTGSPASFVSGTVLEAMDEEQEEDRGLFHVTTNLPGVLAHGRLRSRGQLLAIGAESVGLGGGLRNQAPDRVSTGISLSGAVRVMDGLRMMAQAVHGEIAAHDALVILDDLSSGSLIEIDSALDWMLDDESESETSHAFRQGKLYEAQYDRVRRDVQGATPGPDLYEALRRYEGLIANTIAEWSENSWVEQDEIACSGTVGFTEPAKKFRRVQLDQIGLLKLAARKGAPVELIQAECELRFRSEDLVLIGVWRQE